MENLDTDENLPPRSCKIRANQVNQFCIGEPPHFTWSNTTGSINNFKKVLAYHSLDQIDNRKG
jgi:hypothetical protein